MVFENFWWSSGGGGPGPDPGFPIPESLRFSGDAFLTSNVNGVDQFFVPPGNFTLSMWVKFTTTATDNQSLYGNNDSSRGFKVSSPSNASQPAELVSRSPGQGLDDFGGGTLRDPAAWYNFVFQCNNNVVTCWQNGVRYPETAGMFDRTGNVLIGCGQANAIPDEPLRGYLAQVVCLDGTLEPPESFGRLNNAGVWVPEDINNAFTSDQYGLNGFWLTFDNINNLGEDSAPIGTGHTTANDFASVGFDTMPPGRFSENLAASAAGNYQANAANRTLAVLSPEQAFNGDLSNQAQANGSAAWIYWTTNLTCTSVTLIVNNDPDQTANTTRINGTQVVTPAATLVGSNFEQTFPVANGTLTEFAYFNQGGPNTSIFGMRINGGQVLEDNDGTGFDPMTDSPTQNFATGNPINNPTAFFNAVPILGNLGNDQSTGAVQGGLQPTFPWDANDHLFFEVIVSNYPFNSWFGFNGNPGPNAQTGTIGEGVSNGIINWSMNGGQPLNTMTSVEGPFTGITWTPNYTVQENVVAGWEWDGPNRRIRYYENGVLQSTSSQWAAGSFDTANFFFGYNNAPTAPWTYNFGQQPMTNPPADTIRLQTNDLPEVDILNGRDQFQAIASAPDATPNVLQDDWGQFLFTSPGNGNIDYTSTAKNFQPGSPIANGFNNNPNTFVQCDAGNSWFFAPQNLTASKIEIQVTNAYGDPTGGALVFNNVEQTGFPGQAWYTVYEGPPITNWTIGGWFRPNGGNGFSMIRINSNQVLLEGTPERPGNWSYYCTTNTSFSNQQPVTNGFNGTLNTSSDAAGAANVFTAVTFAPNPPIDITGVTVRMNSPSTDSTITLGGGSVAANGGWVIVDVGTATEISADTPLVITRDQTSASTGFAAIEIDGRILTDGGPLAAAQAAFPTGLWWIKDFDNSNSWQLACSEYTVDPITNVVISDGSGYNVYVAPAGNSMAYSWDISDPATSGCEFISDTGTGVARTVNHNLGRVPAMIWGYNMVAPNSNNIYVYHEAYGPNGAFNLANTNGPDNRTIFWGGDPTQFTTTTFGVGSAGSTNPAQGAVYYWLWAEIPGFSAFGRYDGNGTANNAFVYTGFRPSFVMIKSIAAGGNWQVYDTPRNPYNPASLWLNAATTTPETTGFDIDILSNGFKIRASNGPTAAATGAVYACFAENPFGGSNVSPVTAR